MSPVAAGSASAFLRHGWLAVSLLASGLTGCMVLPAPHVGVIEDPQDSNYRCNLPGDAEARFKPGLSTIEDIVLTYGQPDAVGPDSRSIAYYTRRTKALIVTPIGGGTLSKEVVYVFEFDPRGVLVRAAAIRKKPDKGADQEPVPDGFTLTH